MPARRKLVELAYYGIGIIRRFLVISIGYPCYDQEYIKKNIDRPDTDPVELFEYIGWTRVKLTRIFLVTLSVWHFLRTSTLPVLWNWILSLKNLAANIDIIQSPNGTQYYGFQCLVTNCTRLTTANDLELEVEQTSSYDWQTSSYNYNNNKQANASALTNLAKDFKRLPFLTWCFPLVAEAFDPTQSLDNLGMLTACALGMATIITGALLPGFQELRPTGNLLFSMILAPKVTRRVLGDRAKVLAREMLHSYQNYCSKVCKDIQVKRRLLWPSRLRTLAPKQAGHIASFSALIDRQLHLATSRPTGWPDDYLDEFASDCISVTRSEWWRSRAAVSLLAMYILNFFVFDFVYFGFYLYLNHLISLKKQYYNEVSVFMNTNTTCAIWKRDQGLQPDKRLELADVDLNWSLYSIGRLFVQVWPFYILVFVLVGYYGVNSDIYCWLCELEFQLTIGAELVDQILSDCQASEELRSNGGQPTICEPKNDSMEKIKRTFKSLTDVRLLVVRQHLLGKNQRPTSSHLESIQAMEEFASMLIQDNRLDLNGCVEFMQKLYVSFRIFVDHIHLYAPTVAMVIFYLTLVSYAMVLVSVWFARVPGEFSTEPVLLVFLCWSTTNFCILVASNFHAKVK